MSYDRVLPNPLALCYDSSRHNIPRRIDTLLEHKIMTDKLPNIVTEQYDCRKAIPERKVPEGGPLPLTMTTSPMSSAKPATPMASVSAPAVPRSRVVPLVTTNLDRQERSASSSSSKSSSSKEYNVQFCLCQPDPKIPRPRNGPLSSLSSLCSQ